MSVPRITGAALDHLRITDKTVWTFVRLTAEDGTVGIGEATLPRGHERLATAASRGLDRIVGQPASRSASPLRLGTDDPIAAAAIAAATDVALHDLEGQSGGRPLHALLGEPHRETVPLYANINRATLDRSADGFTGTARRARTHGFTRFKIAPFDEITPEICDTADFADALDAGLARIAATRASIGEGTLRVDCHWRFTPRAAETLIEACVPHGLDWIECPIVEEPTHASAIASLRARANTHGIRLAGLEMGTTVDSFAPFLAAHAYDVIMPDVKYLAGLSRFAELYALAHKHGAVLSLHNPSGPICHATSLHVCAVLPVIDALEYQFDETPLFDDLVARVPPAFRVPQAEVPTGAGLGVALDGNVVENLEKACAS